MKKHMDTTLCKSKNYYVAQILSIIDQKPNQKLTLQAIAKELNLSKEYVSYIFKTTMNKQLTNYINEQKMAIAKDLVLNSEMLLTEIAQTLGFDHYNYFSRLFKKHVGQAPSKMRKNK